MALKTTFANLTGPTSDLLDTNFNQVGAMGITACTVGGTVNAITLIPSTNQPNVGSYQNYQQFSFVAGGGSTAAVTVAVSGLASLNLYLHDATTQAAGSSISANVLYTVAYNGALNAGVGGFQVMSQLPVSKLLDVLGNVQGTILYRGPTTWQSLAPGASGTFLQSQGAGANLQYASGAGASNIFSISFTSAGSFSFSSTSGLASTTTVRLTLSGGGGGGGGSNTTTASGAGGGGGGAILIAYISGLSANTTYSGSVGAGGAPGFGGASVAGGSTGGTTTVSFGGVQFTAGGGLGGREAGVASGGSGGTAANGTILIVGSPGFTGGLIGGTPLGGAGGDGVYGGGGQAIYGGQRGMDGQGPGAGGSGAAQTAGSGGSGATGLFLMEWVQ